MYNQVKTNTSMTIHWVCRQGDGSRDLVDEKQDPSSFLHTEERVNSSHRLNFGVSRLNSKLAHKS